MNIKFQLCAKRLKIKKIIDEQEIHPTNLKEDKEDKLYYGYEFDYKFYKVIDEIQRIFSKSQIKL